MCLHVKRQQTSRYYVHRDNYLNFQWGTKKLNLSLFQYLKINGYHIYVNMIEQNDIFPNIIHRVKKTKLAAFLCTFSARAGRTGPEQQSSLTQNKYY